MPAGCIEALKSPPTPREDEGCGQSYPRLCRRTGASRTVIGALPRAMMTAIVECQAGVACFGHSSDSCHSKLGPPFDHCLQTLNITTRLAALRRHGLAIHSLPHHCLVPARMDGHLRLGTPTAEPTNNSTHPSMSRRVGPAPVPSARCSQPQCDLPGPHSQYQSAVSRWVAEPSQQGSGPSRPGPGGSRNQHV